MENTVIQCNKMTSLQQPLCPVYSQISKSLWHRGSLLRSTAVIKKYRGEEIIFPFQRQLYLF